MTGSNLVKGYQPGTYIIQGSDEIPPSFEPASDQELEYLGNNTWILRGGIHQAQRNCLERHEMTYKRKRD